jgi:putative Holliday junction resolvase
MHHMKLMAIDYGAKRVGIASTDDAGEFALPRKVLPNDANLLREVLDFVEQNKIEKIIIGESRNLKGEANPILTDIIKFADTLSEDGQEVVLHPEIYTSMEAQQIQGKGAMNDASAAAIILKSYLERKQ